MAENIQKAKLSPVEVQFYLSEAKSSEERQKRELIQRWKYPTVVSYYEGDLLIEPNSKDVGVANRQASAIINKHFPKTNVLISEIMFQNPDIIADPTKPFAFKGDKEINVEEGAPLMRGALIYGYEKQGLQEENRMALFDMLYAGYSAVEIDHIKSKRDAGIGVTNIPDDKEFEERRTGIVGKVKEGVKRVKSALSTEKQAEDKLAKEAPPENEAYADVSKTYGRRWDPLNILFDWQAKTIKESRYIIKKRVISKSKFDAEYPKFKDKVQAGKFMQYGMHNADKEKQSVVVYEFQVKKQNAENPDITDYWTIVVTPTLLDETLDMFKRPYTTNGFNIKIGTLHKYGKIYPVPVAKINKVLSDEMNEYIYNWKDVAERNVTKYVRDTKKVKEDGVDALRSNKTNDVIDVDGNPENAIVPLKPTSLSNDNKELIAVFQAEQDKTWNVSDSRTGGQQKAKFATELQIQEAGFQSSTLDIQEGLRKLIQEELETEKDIIVTFWDSEIFIKVTGGPKPEWYKPLTLGGVVINPLSEMLTADYHIKVDVTKAFRPNTEKEKNDLVLLLRELISEPMQIILATPSEEFPTGRQLSPQFLNKIIQKFGQDPEVMFEEKQQAPEGMPGVGQELPPAEGTITPEQIMAGGG